MLFRLSRVSFWLAAAVAGLALLAPGGHETLLTAVAVAACTIAYLAWRSALRGQHRQHAAVARVPEVAPLGDAALLDARAMLADQVAEAASFESALHAAAQVLRSELGAHEVTVCRVHAVDSTHARVADLVHSQPGYQTAPRPLRLSASALGQAITGGRVCVVPPGAAAVPVLCAGRVVAALALTGIELRVEADALAGLLELASGALSQRADDPQFHPGAASGMLDPATAPRETQFDAGRAVLHMPASPHIDPDPAGHGARFREAGFDDHPSQTRHSSSMSPSLTRRPRAQAPAESEYSAAAPAAGSGVVLDPDALARLAELDPAGENHLLERVLLAFQTSAARLRPQADAARLSGDRDVLRRVAHTLKSSAGSIGALRLSGLCAEIESGIRQRADAELGPQFDALGVALDETLQAIAVMLKDLQ